MKIVSLNTWHGKKVAELKEFIAAQQATTDVFCLQESDETFRATIREILPDFAEYFHDKRITETDDPDHHHNEMATYVRRAYPVVNSYALFGDDYDAGSVLITELRVGDNTLAVANVHGACSKVDDKLDTEGRLRQTNTLLDTFRDTPGPVVICGDFNLLPAAKSVKLFAENGYQDLIAEHKIPRTRNHLAYGKFPDNPQYYADYAFVNAQLQVRDFQVIDCEISDHLPLIIEADLVSQAQATARAQVAVA